MEAMQKSKVIESLERIQKSSNENSMAILALIKAAKDVDGELDSDTSSNLRDKLYRVECNGLYDVKSGVTALECKMAALESKMADSEN